MFLESKGGLSAPFFLEDWMEEKDILALKEFYIKDLYSDVRKEQAEDQRYIDDTFEVPEVRSPHKPLRLGVGARMIDSPAEQIITNKPQVFLSMITGGQVIGDKLAKEANSWIDAMRRTNPNPYKESLKNKLARGENYIKLVHNQTWIEGDKPIRSGLPVLFVIPDPMVIYGSPEETEEGIPERVIVFYERQYRDLITNYDAWTNPKGKREKDKIEWFEYWDKNIKYFSADGEVVYFDENIYKFVPFIRKFSGFGRRSPDGKLTSLIMGDLRMSRGLIKENCIMASDISSRHHLGAHVPKTVILAGEVNEDNLRENLSFGTYDLNIIQNVGSPIENNIKIGDIEIKPPSDGEYQYLSSIESKITQRNPFMLAGFPYGSSGRQQDLSSMAAMRRYDTVIENTELEFGIAVEKAFLMCRNVPGLKPDGISKSDLEKTFRCTVKLRADDPLDQDRKATLGDRLWAQGNGSIDLETYHTQFLGYTKDDSDSIKAKMLVDKLTLYNPDVAEVMGMIFAEEAGMDKYIQEAQQRRVMVEQQQKGLQTAPPPSGMERIKGETQQPLGREMMDVALSNKGARRPPSG